MLSKENFKTPCDGIYKKNKRVVNLTKLYKKLH